MTKTDAIAFFGGNVSALARALGIHQSTVYSWGERPPLGRQYQLQEITGGLLKADSHRAANETDRGQRAGLR